MYRLHTTNTQQTHYKHATNTQQTHNKHTLFHHHQTTGRNIGADGTRLNLVWFINDDVRFIIYSWCPQKGRAVMNQFFLFLSLWGLNILKNLFFLLIDLFYLLLLAVFCVCFAVFHTCGPLREHAVPCVNMRSPAWGWSRCRGAAHLTSCHPDDSDWTDTESSSPGQAAISSL